MAKYSEDDMKAAVQDVKNGVSQRKAAALHGVPRATLGGRLSGTLTRREGHESEQRLSPVQEERLRDWYLVQASLGFPPTLPQLREFAARISRQNGHTDAIGNHWTLGFLRRHPAVQTLRREKYEAARSKAAIAKQAKEARRAKAKRENERRATLWPNVWDQDGTEPNVTEPNMTEPNLTEPDVNLDAIS